jgi:hypothetical protein
VTARILVVTLIALLALVASAVPAAGAPDRSQELFGDDFAGGFTTANWFPFAAGPYVGDDGVVTTSDGGLRVISRTGAGGTPAFARTLGQEGSADNPLGLTGGLDHVKWLYYANRTNPATGQPGFAAPTDGRELVCRARISGRSYGTGGHPFGRAVADPDDDLRLGAPAMNTIDFDTFMVFDFFLTNKRVYAFYEHLPFARAAYGNYAAFSFGIPVADRQPGDRHDLAIAYNKAAGTVRWLLDGREVFRVERIGHRVDRRYMVLDHGGVDTTFSPNQLDCGMGLFTLLDGHGPANRGLARLSSAAGFYFNPATGEPAAERFADEVSAAGSRLFGQGAELRLRRYEAYYR